MVMGGFSSFEVFFHFLLQKLERAYTSSLTTHLKALEQKETNSRRRRRRWEIIKIRAEINQVETKRTIQRINKTRSWFFEKINKTDKPLAKLTKGQRDSIQINKIRNEKGDITTETEEIEKNHQILLQKLIFNTTGESGGNGQFPRQIQNTKIKSGSHRSYKEFKHRTRWF